MGITAKGRGRPRENDNAEKVVDLATFANDGADIALVEEMMDLGSPTHPVVGPARLQYPSVGALNGLCRFLCIDFVDELPVSSTPKKSRNAVPPNRQ